MSMIKIKTLNNNIPPLYCGGQKTVKNWQNLPTSNPKQDHNINAHTKFGKNPFIFTQVIVRKQKYGWWWADISQKLTKFAHQQSPTSSLQYQCTHQVW